MEIKKIAVTIEDLCKDYVNDSEIQIEDAVTAYSGKLCVRPAFQRAFVYDKKQENAVIDTALKGFPLNIMYWVDNGDGTYRLGIKNGATLENGEAITEEYLD